MDRAKGLIFDIKRDCSEDGPGIRTTVFFKGCPLSCVWCHNPEGISSRPSLSFSIDRCNPAQCGGYTCLEVCPSDVFKKNNANGKIEVDYNACTRCEACFDVCTPRALEPVGKWWGVRQLVNKILPDRHFFHSTGGGVTLSGGEPCLQMEFAHRFLTELKEEDIHTGIETCGMFHLEKFRKYLLPYLDFIYFDLKLIAADESLRYTGCSNDEILKNFLFLCNASEIPVVPRIPLIPDITATEKNLAGISYFLKDHGVTACCLMPYNPMWQDKAVNNGVEVKYSHTAFMSEKEEESCVQFFKPKS